MNEQVEIQAVSQRLSKQWKNNVYTINCVFYNEITMDFDEKISRKIFSNVRLMKY